MIMPKKLLFFDPDDCIDFGVGERRAVVSRIVVAYRSTSPTSLPEERQRRKEVRLSANSVTIGLFVLM
jgi:hypothetical protein